MVEFAPDDVEHVAKAICAADYVQGPHLTDEAAIAERWALLSREMVEHYSVLAIRAMRACVDRALVRAA